MINVENALFLLAAAAAFWIFKQSKRQKHPARLGELQTALRTQADLRLYRNKDPETSTRLNRLADDLGVAQTMLNDPVEHVRTHWPRIRPSILRLSSEESLKEADLFYTDRAQNIREALFDLAGAWTR